jgi:acid phosphatase type 7
MRGSIVALSVLAALVAVAPADAGRIAGTPRADSLRGTAGADVILAGAGRDTLIGRAGPDRLYSGRGNDTADGGLGADLVAGGPGGDRLVGGDGADVLDGGPGADRLHARDGGRDRVACGLGRDVVSADAADSVGRGCEVVLLPPRDTPLPPPPAVLLAAGDIADCASPGDEATAALLDARPAAAIATLGDHAYPDGTTQEFAACYGPSWGRHRGRTRPALGNHDLHVAAGAGYFSYFGPAAGDPAKGYYSYDLGAWHLIALDSERDIGPTGAQVAWLRADLAATSASCVLAYWHRPRFSAGNYSDAVEYRPFWDALYAANADVVLAGHDHNYQRFVPLDPAGAADPSRGIRQFVVGTGGRSHYALRPDPRREAGNDTSWGVLELTLHPGRFEWQFVPVEGSSYRDVGTASCH